MLCFVVAGALISVGAWTNLVFMVVIIANMVIGIFQEIKAKKTIEKISLVTEPTAVVIRNGKQEEIPVSEIVLDDIIVFTLGKQISADCIVVDGEVEVNESLLTGESVAIKKVVGDTLLSGSFIVSGKCLAKADKVGSESYTAQLAVKAKQYKKAKSELLNSLNLIIKIIGIIIIPLAIFTFYNNYTQPGSNLTGTITKTAGSIVGMIPAGMFLLTSLALAVGVIKLAKKRTLVQDLYSIEMLARTDVLCLDKTGTITDGTMKVNSVIQFKTSLSSTVNEIVGSMLTALDDNNQTSRALATYFGYSKELSAKTTLPFSSKRKLSAVTFKNGDTFAFGAPEFIMKTKNAEVEKLVKQYASKGFRVLLLAKGEGEIVKDKLPVKMEPVAIIVIEDRIREHAAETIEWFKKNGVAIKIISGDNPLTVSEVSKRVGVENAGHYISLEGLSEQQVIDAAEKYSVFGRVSPEQKYILVKA
jgi:cation-transporting ATPase E